MLRILGTACLTLFLCSCSYFSHNSIRTNDQYARCVELKRQIMFLNATNDELVATQREAGAAALYRSYRENGC